MASHDSHKTQESSVQQVGRAQSCQPSVEQVDEQGQLKSKVQISSETATSKLAIAPAQPEARRPVPKVSRVADAFLGGVARFPNNPVIAAGFEAIYKGGKRARLLQGGWGQSEGGQLHYIHAGNKTGRILVHPDLLRKLEVPSTNTEPPWRFVEGLNPFTADVALAVLAQMCEPTAGDRPKHPLLQPVRITADTILHYKGIRRRGMERRILRKKVHDEMERLRRLNLNVESFTTFNPSTRRSERVSWEGDRLFDIVRVEVIPETFEGETTNIEVAWLVRAGQWAYWWFSRESRMWVGKMARALLELDHRENRGPAVLAKKVGQKVLFLYHALREQNPLKLNIGNLLEDIGELPISEARKHNWAGRTRENFERALTILGPGDSLVKGINIFARVDWPDGHGLDDTDRFKGWVDKWLSANILITLPSSTSALPSEKYEVSRKTKRLRKKMSASADEIVGPSIREARLKSESFLTQKLLATNLGISTTYLSQIETGKRQPSRALMVKLREFVKHR